MLQVICLDCQCNLVLAALQSGFYKTDLPEKDSVTNLLIDVGHASTSVCVISFVKSGFKVQFLIYCVFTRKGFGFAV